jgi:hypothetical protein
LACVANFTESFKQAIASIQALPEQITNATVGQARLIAEQFVGAAKELENAARIDFDNQTANIPSSVLNMITEPSEEGANAFITFVEQNTPSGNAALANSTGTLMEKSSSP